MATKTVQVLTCDPCGSQDSVSTHTVRIDGRTVELESCESCWAPLTEPVSLLMKHGRRVKTVKAASSNTRKPGPKPGANAAAKAAATPDSASSQVTPRAASGRAPAASKTAAKRPARTAKSTPKSTPKSTGKRRRPGA